MENDNECYFCQEIESPYKNILQKPRIVLETEHFVVFPTVGCFRIGYLLIMPKQHYLCFGELEDNVIDELNHIIIKLSSYIYTKTGNQCVVFEHGTRDLSKLTSTSIMHAHIHILPFEYNIHDFIPTYCILKKINGFSDLNNVHRNYLFFKDISDNNYVIENDEYPSQFFRRIICEALGIPNFWNWRRYPFVENIDITIDFYKDL